METKDLILRNWQDSDAKALYEMCLDETLRKSGETTFLREKVCIIKKKHVKQMLSAGMMMI